ncbi:MAG TPA: hypothetical protein VFJ90_12060 [Candidatus Didemnitutus sp.]|nr:hypothetical protein [Candidatus Didemnitutus sp.]
MKIGVCANVTDRSPLLQRYLSGDGFTRGLLATYRSAGHAASSFSPEFFSSNLDRCVDEYDAFDLTLALVSSDIVFRVLAAGKRVIGFRHPAVERKSIAARIASICPGNAGPFHIPAHVLARSRHEIDRAVRAVEGDVRFGEFLILKGDNSSKSREGLFEHLFVTRAALRRALASADWPFSGITICPVVLATGPANGAVHKIMLVAREASRGQGVHYSALAAEHYLIPNQLDLSAVASAGVSPISSVLRSLAPTWLRGRPAEVPGFARLLEVCSAIEPLGVLLTVDVMVADGVTHLLEANHFSATYADSQFTGRSPIDDAVGAVLLSEFKASDQTRLLRQLESRFSDASGIP